MGRGGAKPHRPLMSLLLGLFLAAAIIQVAHPATIPANLHLEDNTVNALTDYTFQIQPKVPLRVDYMIQIDFGESTGIEVPDSPQCTGSTNFNSNPLCTKLNDYIVQISCQTIKAGQNIYRFSVKGVKNPGVAITLEKLITVSTRTNGGFKVIDQSNELYVAYKPFIVAESQASVRSDDPTVGAYASFTVSMVMGNAVPSDGKIVITFPKWDLEYKGASIITSMVTPNTVTQCSVAFSTPSCDVIIG